MALLVAIEGIDGSGKGTQSLNLVRCLREQGRAVELLSFPRYEHTRFGKEIGRFLNGEFGPLEQVHPFLAATLYAGDRYESRNVLLSALELSDVVVLDRYVASNLAHQGSRLDSPDERHNLTQRICDLEFTTYALPAPDLTILLDISGQTARQLVGKKSARSYTDREADLQEENVSYLESVRQAYLELSADQPDWRVVHCEVDSALRSMDAIGQEIIAHVADSLSAAT